MNIRLKYRIDVLTIEFEGQDEIDTLTSICEAARIYLAANKPIKDGYPFGQFEYRHALGMSKQIQRINDAVDGVETL